MANLSDEDRGQIILVAAFAIAVIFVAMALIVNSAIFTENLASRGETSGADGALTMRAMVETNAGDSLDGVNRQAPSDLETAVISSIENVSLQTGRQQARTGRLVNVSYNSHYDGRRVAWNSPGTLDSVGGGDDYEVARDVARTPDANGTRAFEITANDIDTNADSNSSAFVIVANTTSGNPDSWEARIWQDSDIVHVRTLRQVGTGDRTQSDCEVALAEADSTVHLDITGGEINDEPCSALGTNETGANYHFSSGTGGDYDIYFENTDEIDGNFSMIVYDDGGLAVDPLGLLSGVDDTDAIYNISVQYNYTTADLDYETDIRVAPGEPDV